MVRETAALIAARTSRSSWTDDVWKSHYAQQAYRFLRMFVFAFGTMLVTWSPHGVDEHMTWKVLGSLAVAALEVAWREFFPTTPPSPVDPPVDQVVEKSEPEADHTAASRSITPQKTVKKTAKKTTKTTTTRRTPRR